MATINGNYREFRLGNGLLVALQEMPIRTISGRLRVWHGALNENKGEEGIAHFLEHTLIAGGSQKYSPEQSDNVSGGFGSFNAYTSLDRTVFPAGMLPEDIGLFLDYISDTAFNPRFDALRVEEERQRILRETSDEKCSPAFNDNQVYGETFFGKGSPHTYSILGTEEVISSASPDNLRDFHARGYHPNNMDLILVGALPKNIESMIEQSFGQFQPGSGERFEFPKQQPIAGASVMHFYAPDLLNMENPRQSNAHFSMSMSAPPDTDEDTYAVNMLAKILGHDANSLLFTSISQRKGLAYGISASYNGCNNKGIITISGSIHAAKTDEAISAVFGEIAKVQADLVPQKTLDRLKRTFQYKIAKVYQTDEGQVSAIELKMDDGITPEEYLAKNEAVTPEQVREAAVKYLPRSPEEGKYALVLRDPLKT